LNQHFERVAEGRFSSICFSLRPQHFSLYLQRTSHPDAAREAAKRRSGSLHDYSRISARSQSVAETKINLGQQCHRAQLVGVAVMGATENTQGIVQVLPRLFELPPSYRELRQFGIVGPQRRSDTDQLQLSAYVIHYKLDLWSTFTYYLKDPVYGR